MKATTANICDLINQKDFDKNSMLNFMLGYLRSITQYEDFGKPEIERMIELSYNFAIEQKKLKSYE